MIVFGFETNSHDDNLFSVHEQETMVELQLAHYSKDSRTDLEDIQNFPTVNKLCIRFYTPLPSSASVKHLFSFAGMINAPRRHTLSNTNFENIVLLKANTDF